MTAKYDHLLELAISSGASNVQLISSTEIIVEDHLARKCKEPQCENYGLSFSCPPYVEGPAQFRNLIQTHPFAIALRLVVPASMLLSWERVELGKVLHELVANVEMEAKELGYSKSSAFAGGSCKELFCADHLNCRRIAENGACRHPLVARPSLSGYGVDVFQLMKTCEWETNLNEDTSADQLSWVAGLIMIG